MSRDRLQVIQLQSRQEADRNDSNYHTSFKNFMVEKRSSLFTTSMSATKERVLWLWHQEEDGLGQDVGDADEDGADLWPMI